MPIYAYRCESCGFGKDVLQKMSDPQLTQCPECGKDTFRKQVTAAGFQLKGSGWYVTDFRGNSSAGASANGASNGALKGADSASNGNGNGAAQTDTAAASSSAATPAAPAAAPAAAAASGSGSV